MIGLTSLRTNRRADGSRNSIAGGLSPFWTRSTRSWLGRKPWIESGILGLWSSGRYLCEVRAGQYWRLENLKSFDEFLEKRFPESRRKAYYLMAIHEHLPRIPKPDLREVGWTKATALAKIARREGQGFDSATWLHKARSMQTEEFKREVERHLTGKETEAWEILYFKAYKSQLPVIERALEAAALMLGTDKSRGYCLEMICADFLAGVSLETGNQDALLSALTRLILGLPMPQREQLLESVQVAP